MDIRSTTSTEPRTVILHTLKREGPRSADDLSSQLQLSKTAVRAHLLKLEDQGVILRRPAETTGPGSPTLRYELSAEGNALFPTTESDMLFELLNFIQDEGQATLLTSFFTGLWERRQREFQDRYDALEDIDDPHERRLRAVTALMEHHGFMPTIERSSVTGEIQLQACHCPFPSAARATQLPCQMESAFLAKALGRPITQSHWARQDRPGPCSFVFRGVDAPSSIADDESRSD